MSLSETSRVTIFIAVITILGAVASSILVVYLSHIWIDHPELVIIPSKTTQIDGLQNKYGLYQIRVENPGKTVLDDVKGQILFNDDCLIEDSQLVVSPLIFHNESLKSNSYEIELNNLNPDEFLVISLIVKSKSDLPSRPQIAFRSKGVTGKIIESQDNTSKMSLFFLILEGLIASSIALAITFFLNKRNMLNLFCRNPKQ